MTVKDPAAVLDYGINWAAWLVDGDTIITSTWVIESPDDPDLVIDDDTHDDTSTTVWLSAGVAGVRYKLVNQVTTDEGRTDERSMTITCRNR